jgi:hypothetical protein
MRQPDLWDDAALEACGAIFAANRIPETTINNITEDLDLFIGLYFDNQAGQDFSLAVVNQWKVIGADAIALEHQRAARDGFEPLTVDTVVSTLVRKQQDYGHENIRRFGRSGLIMRCHDKVARLNNLYGADLVPNHESINDTLLDIVGYATIGIMWEQEKFLLPLGPPKKVAKLLARTQETR